VVKKAKTCLFVEEKAMWPKYLTKIIRISLLMLIIYFPCFTIIIEAACYKDWTGEEISDYSDRGIPDQNPLYGIAPDLGRDYQDRYYIFDKIIHKKSIRLAVAKDLRLDYPSMQALARHTWLVWARYWAEFQGFAWKDASNYRIDYTGILKRWEGFNADGTNGVGSNTWFRYSFVNPLPDVYCEEQVRGMIAHEILHAWIGGTVMRSSNAEKWFIEGIPDYYKARIASDDTLTNARYVYLNGILASPDHNVPLSKIAIDDSRYSQDAYTKGALVGYLLDKKLSEEGYDLGYLMRYLYLNYGLNQKSITNEDIIYSLNVITGTDFRRFFNDYVYGITPLPLPEGEFEYIPHYFLEISTNQDIYREGDSFSLKLNFANPEKGFKADFFMGLITPGSDIYFFNRTMNLVNANFFEAQTYVPMVENPSIPAGQTFLDTQLFAVTLPEIPTGKYRVFAFLAQPRTAHTAELRMIGGLSQKAITVIAK
jgi:hypothetical protein